MTDIAIALRRDRSLKVPKTAEMIARRLREELRDQPLAPGAPLPTESQLRERFGASRATVREALRLLEAQQLVRIARGATGGARFRLPEIEMVAEHAGIYLEAHRTTQQDFSEARLNLEPCIIGFIAEAGQAAEIGRLAESVAAQKAAGGDFTRFSREHEHFYEILAAICPNKTLSLFLQILRELIRAQTEPNLLIPAAPFTKALSAHIRAKERLIELLLLRDRPGAEAWWRRHLEAQIKQMKAAGRDQMLLRTF